MTKKITLTLDKAQIELLIRSAHGIPNSPEHKITWDVAHERIIVTPVDAQEVDVNEDHPHVTG